MRQQVNASAAQQSLSVRDSPVDNPLTPICNTGYSALPAHTAAALAPPPAGQPAVDAAEVASKQVRTAPEGLAP